MSVPGVPDACPPFNFHFCPADRPHLLGMIFPEIPGLPSGVDSLGRHFSAVAVEGLGDPKAMPAAEWSSALRTIAGELERAEYHHQRFKDVIKTLKERRRIAGGGVFGDPGPAAALYNEAAACMAAYRTAVDVIIYVAARRNGANESAAEQWDASKAIAPPAGTPSPKYEVDDIRALRAHRGWYEKLNLYRNAISHRGWHERSFGYYESWEQLPEASDPTHNAMLAPDYAALKAGLRPHAWTYSERVWLDTLLAELERGAQSTVESLMPVWRFEYAPAGTKPREEHPTVFLTVPLVRPMSGDREQRIAIFESRAAFRTFERSLATLGWQVLNARLRPIRRSTLTTGKKFILTCDRSALGPKLKLSFYGLKNGRLEVNDNELDTDVVLGRRPENILFFDLPNHLSDSVYILEAY